MAGFDYVILGAGSAGCVLANRLSADPNIRVLLVEAGPADRSPLIKAPGGLLPIMMGGLYTWPYRTEPQKHLAGRVLYSPRGKVLGGGSSVNGMVYCRGTAADYDRWQQMGNRGWSYADVMPYFKRAETYTPHRDMFHGDDGPVQISRPGVSHPLSKAWIAAGREAGYPYNDDTNGATREGFGPVDLTVGRGRRSSSASAYLAPVRRRANLTVVTEALVTRIRFAGTRAVGADYVKDGRTETAEANREVIVSAGAVASPQLLMLSGIGDGDHLGSFGITTVVDSKGVGQNLQDHLAAAVRFACTTPISLYNYMSPIAGATALGQYLLFRSGPLATAGMEAIAFVKSRPEILDPDIKFHFAMALYQNNGREFVRRHGFFAHINVVRPDSVGSIRLRSGEPKDPPALDPNFLAAESDRRLLREAVKRAREVFYQPAFDRYRGEEIAPGPDVTSDDAIDAYVRAQSEADYHSVGTCRMGSDPMAVVDDQLRVHGTSGLRVVDASIMPKIVGGNTNMPVIMIAEKAADLILGRPPLPRFASDPSRAVAEPVL